MAGKGGEAGGGKFGKGIDRTRSLPTGPQDAAQPNISQQESSNFSRASKGGGKYGGDATPDAADPSMAKQDSSSFTRAPLGSKGGGKFGGGDAWPEGGGKGGDRNSVGGARVPGGKPSGPPRIQVEFCPDPKTQDAKFTATYDRSSPVNFASLNAGDGKLFVGGGAMNKQFARDLEGSATQDAKSYQALHVRLFEAAAQSPGELFEASAEVLGGDPNLMAAYVLKPPSTAKDVHPKVGVVFIDVFQPTKRPHGHEKNVAMLYTVGPKRQDCSDDSEFVAALRELSSNVSKACSQYNQRGAEPPLEKIRICLVSGGDFAGRVPKQQVAQAICQGLNTGAQERAPIFEFAFDGNVFEQTWIAMHG